MQELEHGEAWGNIAAIHMRRRQPELAYPALQEALKHKRENWRMWENLLFVSMDLKKFSDVVFVMHRLLELRYVITVQRVLVGGLKHAYALTCAGCWATTLQGEEQAAGALAHSA